MSLIKKAQDLWNPWSDFLDSDRFLSFDWGKKMHSVPSVNIKENGKEFKIEMAAPGMSKNDFKVSVENDMLTISAEKKEEKKDETEKYTRHEYSYNSFSRSFSLPENADGENAVANYENGVLYISLPKKVEEEKKAGKEISVA